MFPLCPRDASIVPSYLAHRYHPVGSTLKYVTNPAQLLFSGPLWSSLNKGATVILLEQVDVTLVKTFLTFSILEENPKSLACSILCSSPCSSLFPFQTFYVFLLLFIGFPPLECNCMKEGGCLFLVHPCACKTAPNMW